MEEDQQVHRLNGLNDAERPVYANGVAHHADGRDGSMGDNTRRGDANHAHEIKETNDIQPLINGSHSAEEPDVAQDTPINRFTRPYVPARWLADHENESKPSTDGHDSDLHANGISHIAPYLPRFKLTGHRNHVSAIRFSQDGNWMATAAGDGRILLFKVDLDNTHDTPPTFVRVYTVPVPEKTIVKPDQDERSVPPSASSGINDIAFSPDCKHIASASNDNFVRLWSVEASDASAALSNDSYGGTFDHGYRGANAYARRPAKPAKPAKSASTDGADDSMPVSEASEIDPGPFPDVWINGQLPPGEGVGVANQPVAILRGHTSYAFCLAYAPQGNVLASGSFDETIRIWNIKKRRCVRTMPAHSDPVTSISFSGDGTLICSCSHDGMLRLWDASTGQCLKSLVGEANPPATFCTFTPNARYILCATLDSTIRMWDYHAAQCVKVYSGHKNVKYHTNALIQLITTKESPTLPKIYIVSGSEDGKIVFWNLQTRHIEYEMDGLDGIVQSIAWNAVAGLLATSAHSQSNAVVVWTKT